MPNILKLLLAPFCFYGAERIGYLKRICLVVEQKNISSFMETLLGPINLFVNIESQGLLQCL
jgi:hypothetical protein